MQRLLIIMLGSAVLLAIALGIYFFFFMPRDTGITIETPQNPFGPSGVFEPSDAAGPALGSAVVGAGEEVGPSLYRITEEPVADGLALFPISEVRSIGDASATSSATTTVRDIELRYAERGTGNLYAFRLSARTLTRLTNETVPGVVEASWLKDGSLAFLRFLSTDGSESVQTYALPVSGEGYFLEPGLEQVVVTGSSTAITLLPSVSGSVATLARADGSVIRTLFSSDLASLRIAPTGAAGAVAYTKASASVNGFGFLVNSAGAFDLIAGPLRGLTLLPSPSGKTVLAGYREGNAYRLQLIDVASRTMTALPVSTLPEKCVWTSNEQALYCAVPRSLPQGLPDSWYQGSVATSDRIWKVSVTDRVALMIADPLELAEDDLDMISLTLDENAGALGFVNRIDGSLWLYDL